MTKTNPPKHIVLYADDDPDDLLLVQEAFLQYSANVEMITAENGIEALAYLRSLDAFDPAPCLIILDINMPRLDGKETLKTIRNMDRFKDIPVVLFTTSSSYADRFFAEKYKAGFITKPIEARQMALIADQLVDHCSDQIRMNIKRN